MLLRVLFIQLFDALPGQIHQQLVLRLRLFGRIPKISEQAEVQVLVPICQEPDFQRFHQSRDVLRAREHSRDHHEGAKFPRNSFGEVQARQRLWPHQQRRQPVYQGYRQMTGAQEREDPDHPEYPTG